MLLHALLRWPSPGLRLSRRVSHHRQLRPCSSTPCMHLSTLPLQWDLTRLGCSITAQRLGRHKLDTRWTRPPQTLQLCPIRLLTATRRSCHRLTTSEASTRRTVDQPSRHRHVLFTRLNTATPGRAESAIGKQMEWQPSSGHVSVQQLSLIVL